MSKPRLAISFSGGRTSGYMSKRLLDQYRDEYEISMQFANTGQEDEETLKFVDRCDRDFGFNLNWVEAVVHPEAGEGTTHKIVDYMTASRNGEPFEAVIQKYGIPNKVYQTCNREMKLRSMKSYLRSIGWETGTYRTAIGIRADEADRMASGYEKDKLWYPLIEWGVRKQDVLDWWKKQPFDLQLTEIMGNCVTCWKKSKRKLLTLVRERPEAFDFFRRMEQKYPYAGAGDGPRVFFRGKLSTDDLFALAKESFEPWSPDLQTTIDFDDMDVGSACGESCEVGADTDEDLEEVY